MIVCQFRAPGSNSFDSFELQEVILLIVSGSHAIQTHLLPEATTGRRIDRDQIGVVMGRREGVKGVGAALIMNGLLDF